MNTGDIEQPRWIYRFDNYKRAFLLLREAVEIMNERELTQLEKEGLIQRFEYTWELAWKTLKDYLEFEGIILDKITPASVIRAAFEAKLIQQADLWMKALDARNKMSHTYNLQKFEQVVKQIRHDFYELLDDLYLFFLQASSEQL
jgi:nucleotidyltransferase substrate binding protein (TIGR01987 family)